MKKIVRYVLPFCFLLGICMVLSIPQVKAQVPQKFNYQGIARDAKGNPIGKQSLSLKIAVLATEDATVSDYEETQQVTTNEFGLYTLQIGNGTPTASFTTLGMTNVKWETGNKYIRVAIDPKGGNDYQVVGTTQLLSVPYAIYADKAGVARETTTTTGGTRAGAVSTSASGTGTTNYLTKFVAANTIFNSQIFDNGTNVGLGTASPSSKFHIFTNAGNQEHLRMENTNPGGWGKFIMYNDNVLNYHTFTKYGSTVAGSYGSGSTLFPYANLMVFGSNNSPTVLANGHNIGFATVNGATATFKFIGVQSTGNVGIGGNATPATNVQINRTDATGDTLKITNNTTGHLATDGLDIRNTGNNAEIINRENAVLAFGTNNTERARIDASGNVGIGTTTPGARLEVAGQVKITGGAPGVGKVLTSDATGLATWQTPAAGGGGVTSVNGATGVVTQSITMGSTGTNTNITGSGTNTVTIHIPTANATNTGKLSNTDWTTFNNKANTSTGTTDYVAKYTNGNTIGISKLLENTSGLAYNFPGQAVIPAFGLNTGITLNNSAENMILRSTNLGWNYLSVVSPSTYKGFWLLDSSKTFDSITFLHRYEPTNTFSIGSLSNEQQFSVRMNDGRMGNLIGDALFTINTDVDTAASFTTNASNGQNHYGVISEAGSDYQATGIQSNAYYTGSGNPTYTRAFRAYVDAGTQDAYVFDGSISNGFGANGFVAGLNLSTNQFGGGSNTGINLGAYSYSTTGNANTRGGIIYAAAPDSNQGSVIGLDVVASGGDNAVIGVRGEATGRYISGLGSTDAYGVYGQGYGGVGSSDNVYSIYGGAATGGLFNNYSGYFNGNTHVNGVLSKSSGTFKIDHPQDPENKYLIHSFVESPDMMNVYNGNITTDANGNAVVTLPGYFEAENKDFKYQLTVIDNSNDFVMAKVTNEVANNNFSIKTSKPNVKVSWQVTGVRQDAWANAHRVVAEVEKGEREKGKYLNPEVFGKDKSLAMNPEPEHEKVEVSAKEKAEKEATQKYISEMKNKKKKVETRAILPTGTR